MAPLSTPVGNLRSQYGALVVGTGYGGAIAAYALATYASRVGPRFSVCVLERGDEFQAGDFPGTVRAAASQVQADTRFGRFGRRNALFDFRINPDVSALVGCGLGGTSLINAGVMLPPSADVLRDPAWPAALRNDPHALERAFARVQLDLGAAPVPDDVPVEKFTRLVEAGTPQAAQRAPIAVSFAAEVNRFDVQRNRCVLCGDCLTGCNHGAKNTVAANYLPGAVARGAEIFCGVGVRAVERGPDGFWHVHAELRDAATARFNAPPIVVRARAVFLAAGTLGSTEILLRSRDAGRLRCSPTLGTRFSTNGDAIAFGYNAAEPVDGIGYGDHVPRDANVGPLITGMIDDRRRKSGAMIQEGAIPGVLAPLLRLFAPIMARVTHVVSDDSFDLRFRHLFRELDSLIRGAHHGALRRTITFLAMSRDSAGGVMRLVDDRLRIQWKNAGEGPTFRKIARRLAEMTRRIKGRYVINPFWSRLFGRRLVTVHPLGGCPMGDSAATGTVDDRGRVFDESGGVHGGLYVCDGSVVPLALGANPALTISALAIRIARTAAAEVARDAQDDPVRQPAAVRSTPGVAGIRYGERLRGVMSFRGRNTRVELMLHISAVSVERLISDSPHEAQVLGVVRAPDLAPGYQRFTVADGSAFFVLNDDAVRIDTKLIGYRLHLIATNGERFLLTGEKVIHPAHGREGAWRPPPGRRFELCDGPPAARVECGIGVVRSSVVDVVRMLASMEITNERRLLRRARLLLRYGWFFADAVIQARFWLFRRTERIDPFDRPPEPDLPRLMVARRIVDRENPPRYRLTEYTLRRGASKGPVLLAPGFGMSTYAFRVGRKSFVEYLCEQGYAVWLFDYRSSDRLDASLQQFTVDDLALRDFPDAIRQVREASGERVRLVAHCVASVTTLMAMLSGTLTRRDVRSAVLSQYFAFVEQPWFNRLKASLRLAELLKWLNFRPVLTAGYDVQASLPARVLDKLLLLYPSEERCSSGVCRRLLFMYGEVIRHDRIDRHTHDRMYDMFGRANLTFFEQMTAMVRCHRAVDRHGQDTYLTVDNARNLQVPLTLVQGTANGLFRPKGGAEMIEWLHAHGPYKPHNDRWFQLLSLPGVGHLDTFIGRDAERTAFKPILAALERMDQI